MATLTVRNIPDEDLAALRVRAAMHGRSMEAEVREMIRQPVSEEPRIQPPRLEDLPPVPPEVRARVERVQAMVREAFGGAMPKGRVDAFLAERRAAAERGE
jgi:plasmid stability protein